MERLNTTKTPDMMLGSKSHMMKDFARGRIPAGDHKAHIPSKRSTGALK